MAHHKKPIPEDQVLESQSPPSSIEGPAIGGRGRGLFAALAEQRSKALSTIDSDSITKVTESVKSVSLDTSSGEPEPVHKRGSKGK